MATAASTPVSGKKLSFGVADADNAPPDRHARIARASLHNLIAFYELLDEEMAAMMRDHTEHGTALDKELFDRMVAVKEKYLHVMCGLTDDDYRRERHVLIGFADAVQDLMAYVHIQRRH